MKVALVTDLHFGARSDSQQFDNYFRKFYTECFFPYLEQNGIKTVFDLGDTFDRRKYINYNTLKSCKEYFFDVAANNNIDIHMIPGNHDTYYKNTNEVNSPGLLLSSYNNITLYEEPTDVDFGNGKTVLVMPWICGENYERCYNKIKGSESKVCFGHFELSGFDMYRGIPNVHGMDPNLFDGFNLVVSGHFHHRHSRGNITYMGNPYEITWADFEDPRGFAIFDTETQELEFVNNPFRMFHKIYYDDTEECVADNFNFDEIKNCCVKLVVTKKTDYQKFDMFVENLYNCNLVELKIIEDFSEFEDEALGEDLNIEDTMTLLKEYVDGVNTDLDKERLKGLLQSLYVEAQDFA